MASVETTTTPQQHTPAAAEPAALEQRLVGTILTVGLWIVTAVTFASAAVIVAAHLNDRFDLNAASGTWMALASDFHDGTLYRAPFEAGSFGGTWYMPIQLFLYTGMSFVTGEYVVAGKLVALILAALLYGLVFLVLRQVLGSATLISLGLVAALLVTSTGFHAVTAIRGDALPVIFQVAALALLYRTTSRRAVAVAGLLCALALLSKLTAVWALVAIAIWLLVRERRLLIPFLGVFASTVLVALVGVDLLSDGRLFDNLATVADGDSGATLAGGLSWFFSLLVARASAIYLLLPVALLAVVVGVARRRLTLFQLAFLVSLPLLLAIFGTPGSDYNHLIDLGVLTVLVVGEFTARARSSSERVGEMSWVTALVALTVIVGVTDSYRVSMKPALKTAAQELLGRTATPYPTRPLAGIVAPTETLLSEDPTVPVAMGERPVIIDSIMLRRLVSAHPEWKADLERRIGAGAFDKIVLTQPLQHTGFYVDSFGLGIRDAIRDHYRLETHVWRPPFTYWVYVPDQVESAG